MKQLQKYETTDGVLFDVASLAYEHEFSIYAPCRVREIVLAIEEKECVGLEEDQRGAMVRGIIRLRDEITQALAAMMEAKARYETHRDMEHQNAMESAPYNTGSPLVSGEIKGGTIHLTTLGSAPTAGMAEEGLVVFAADGEVDKEATQEVRALRWKSPRLRVVRPSFPDHVVLESQRRLEAPRTHGNLIFAAGCVISVDTFEVSHATTDAEMASLTAPDIRYLNGQETRNALD